MDVMGGLSRRASILSGTVQSLGLVGNLQGETSRRIESGFDVQYAVAFRG